MADLGARLMPVTDASNYTLPSTSKGLEWLARMGYVAKGVVYATVGVLAAMTALGVGGDTTGTEGAVSRIGRQPFGLVLIGLIAAGLLGYVVWRFTQAIKDPEHKGKDASGLIQRAGYVISGLIYGALALYTVSLLLGTLGTGGSSVSGSSLTAELMSYQGGIWAVAAVGAIIMGVGIAQFVRAYREKFKERWNVSQMSQAQEAWASRASRWGLGARGLVFGVIGGFLITAAWHADPSEAKGLEGRSTNSPANPMDRGCWAWSPLASFVTAYTASSMPVIDGSMSE
jgi:hypothetical protein